jgi:hypothetical protein
MYIKNKFVKILSAIFVILFLYLSFPVYGDDLEDNSESINIKDISTQETSSSLSEK